MMEDGFWARWLSAYGLLIACLGLGTAFLGGTPLASAFSSLFEGVFFAPIGAPAGFALYRGWIYGVLGATMAGWGIFLTFIARHAFAKKERWAWDCVMSGMLVWYAVDTLVSISYGVYAKAALNTVLLAAGLLPLVMARKTLF